MYLIGIHNGPKVKFPFPSAATDLSPGRKGELLWWVQNLEIWNSAFLLNQPSQVLLWTYASMTGLTKGHYYKEKEASGFGHARRGSGIKPN